MEQIPSKQTVFGQTTSEQTDSEKRTLEQTASQQTASAQTALKQTACKDEALHQSSIPTAAHHGANADLLQEQLNRVDHFQIVSDVFKQLGDTTRIRIFWLLCHCEECVMHISAMMNMSSPAVSHHLRPLKNSGLIVSRRDKKEVYYRAADTEQSRLLHRMIEQVMEITCPQL